MTEGEGLISEEACDVLVDFLSGGRAGDTTATATATASLSTSPCLLTALELDKVKWHHRRRLLAAVQNNGSSKVKKPHIDGYGYMDLDESGTSSSAGLADLLRHKTDHFTHIMLQDCVLPFQHILPLLRGQSKLTSLHLDYCYRIRNRANYYEDPVQHLFRDPECTQLFVDNVLTCTTSKIKYLGVYGCGMRKNRPLMDGFHKNTTLLRVDVVDEDYEGSHEHDYADIYDCLFAMQDRNLYMKLSAHIRSVLRVGSYPLHAAARSNRNVVVVVVDLFTSTSCRQ
jgi:hypothetical protein